MSQQTCLSCQGKSDGSLRAALWEEEEKGRLVARGVVLCSSCHEEFLSGRLTRVELAEKYHDDLGYTPAEWIDRIDRDTLLDIACLECGVLLRVSSGESATATCSRCGAVNRFAARTTASGRAWITAAVDVTPERG